MSQSFSWRRADLVRSYGYSREFIFMCSNEDIQNIYYNITGGI